MVTLASPRKYSEFITFPIELYNEKVQYDQVPDESAPPPKEGEKQKMKSVPRSVFEWDVMNKMKPIWLRNPDVVNSSEYTEFYKTTFKAVHKGSGARMAHVPSSWVNCPLQSES